MEGYLRYLVLLGALSLAAIGVAFPKIGLFGGSADVAPTTASANETTSAILANAEWSNDLKATLEHAKDSGKPVLIDFFATWCPPCKLMDSKTFSHQDVKEKLKGHALVKVDVDQYPDLARQYNISGMPTMVCLNPDGTELKRHSGFVPPQTMIKMLDECKPPTNRGGSL